MPTELKPLSKANHTISYPPTLNDVKTSALMRIADATEKMASNYQRMERDLADYKRWNDEYKQSIFARDRSIAALRGQITKLKNKLKKTFE